MKSVLLIGLGRFGRHMAAKLQELHHEVLAVDREESRVNDILPLVTNARSATAPTRPSIASLGGCATFDRGAWWPHWATTSRVLWRPPPC